MAPQVSEPEQASGRGQPRRPGPREIVLSLLGAFAPLIVFYGLDWTLGLRTAIASTVVFMIADVWRRKRKGETLPRIYVLTAVLTVGFGLIDLQLTTPLMLNYEPVATNLAIAVFFAAGARGATPLLLEMVEQGEGRRYPRRADIVQFFRYPTLAWAGYFVAKALVYLWMAQFVSVERGMALRSVIGTGSMIAMFALSLQAHRAFRMLRRWGWLPPPRRVAA
jgi:uncharacterized membrane protein